MMETEEPQVCTMSSGMGEAKLGEVWNGSSSGVQGQSTIGESWKEAP